MFLIEHFRYQRVATGIAALFLFCGEVQGIHFGLLYVGFLARNFLLLREISDNLRIEGFNEGGGKEGKSNYDQQGNKGCKD
jgi:hypothetical protein